MASLRLKPPNPFNSWSPNLLLYCLGEEADNIWTSTNVTEEDHKKYGEMMAKFDRFFKVTHNVILDH